MINDLPQDDAELQQFETEQRAKVPLLEERLRELCLASNAMSVGLPLEADDHLGFMALLFHAKQLQHAEALLLLGAHADISLVGRSMLEGLALLKWAGQDPTRALRWRHFSAIVDWRTIRRLDVDGVTVTAERRAENALQLAKLGDDFLSAKALKARNEKKAMPADPWVSRWYPPPLQQVFESVAAEALYDGPYNQMSDWHHWSPGGLGRAISSDGTTISFAPRSFAMQYVALACGYQCVAETGLFVAQHFKSDRAADLQARIQAFVTLLGEDNPEQPAPAP